MLNLWLGKGLSSKHEILTRIPRDTEGKKQGSSSFLKLYISHTQPYFFPARRSMAAYLQMGEASKAAYTAAPKRTPTKPLKYIFEIRLGIPHFCSFQRGAQNLLVTFFFRQLQSPWGLFACQALFGTGFRMLRDIHIIVAGIVGVVLTLVSQAAILSILVMPCFVQLCSFLYRRTYSFTSVYGACMNTAQKAGQLEGFRSIAAFVFHLKSNSSKFLLFLRLFKKGVWSKVSGVHTTVWVANGKINVIIGP